jgi:chromosome segregation ATPase
VETLSEPNAATISSEPDAATKVKLIALENEVISAESIVTSLKSDLWVAKSNTQRLEGELIAAANNTQTLERELRAAQDRSRTLSNELHEARMTTNKRDSDLRSAQQRITQLQSDVDRLNKEKSIREDIVAAQINNVLYERLKLENSVKTHQSEIRGLKAENKSLTDKANSTAADNARLRRDIVNMDNDLNPLREEDFYIQSFREIRTDIESWVVTHAIDITEALSKNEEQYLLQHLSSVGPKSKTAADFLGKKSLARSLYKNPRCRIPLIRYIIALFLFDQIFEPFAFGFTPQFSQVLLWIDADIVSYG